MWNVKHSPRIGLDVCFNNLFFPQSDQFFIFMFWMTGRGKGRGRDKRLNLDVSFPERRLGRAAQKSGCNGFAYAFSARIRIIPWRLPGKWKEDTVMPFASRPWHKCSHAFNHLICLREVERAFCFRSYTTNTHLDVFCSWAFDLRWIYLRL